MLREDWQHKFRRKMVERIARRDPEREKEEPTEIEDFGFHFPEDYLDQVCWVLERSGFSYWPKAGGLDDQDSFLVQDVMTWFNLEERLKWEYENNQWSGPRDAPDPDVPPKFNPLDAHR